MKSEKKKVKRKPPKIPIKSKQYDLFSQFVTNDQSEVSNTVEIWESIPKYFFTPRQVEKLRTKTGHANPYKWEYRYKDVSFIVKIQPALIEQKDGSYKACFPGVTEELVEEALKKILCDQRNGFHDPKNAETWVRFTLSMLQKELKIRGRTRDRNQIRHAIEVMASSILTLYKENREVWRGSILQDLVTIGRDEYLADSDAHHIARLPLFISRAINELEYRQFNYDRLMSCDEQLTRWIYKQMINRYRQANTINDYHFMYSSVERNSGLLQQGRSNDNRRKVIAALEELISCKVLRRYDTELRKEGRRITDVKYTVTPSLEFISEQKAANKRSTSRQRLEEKANIT